MKLLVIRHGESEADLLDVHEGRAGHARTSTTTDIYSHFLKSSDKTAVEMLEQMFE